LSLIYKFSASRRGHIVVGFTTTYEISATNIVSLNSAYGNVYSLQYYVIKVVSDLRQVGGFPSF
jgi:hypothetical protein